MSDSRVKCNRCDTSEADLRRCTGCYTVYYCSRDCQRLDRTSHKKHCTRQSANQSSDDNRNTSKTTNANSATTQATTVNSNQIPNTPEKDSSEAQRDVEGARGNSGVDSDVNQPENAAKPGSTHTAFPFKEEKGTCIKCKIRYCTMLCGNCKATFYCSKKCQQSDWPEHKKHCKKVSDGGIPQKKSPLTDDEAFIIDNMKRRQQRFNEGMFERHHGTSRFLVADFTGPPERLLASATPDMLTIHERPSNSLSKALRYAKACFPGWTLIEDFEDIPHERSRAMILVQELQKQSTRNVLVAFMFMYHDHVMRHGVFLKDASDKITHVEFYFDHINDDPSPHFSYADLTPGNYILIQNPLVHQFGDGQIGLRINNPAEVAFYKTEEQL